MLMCCWTNMVVSVAKAIWVLPLVRTSRRVHLERRRNTFGVSTRWAQGGPSCCDTVMMAKSDSIKSLHHWLSTAQRQMDICSELAHLEVCLHPKLAATNAFSPGLLWFNPYCMIDLFGFQHLTTISCRSFDKSKVGNGWIVTNTLSHNQSGHYIRIWSFDGTNLGNVGLKKPN